jgi:protein arginine kinase activator
LGCAACYDALKPILMPLIAGLHKQSRHKGKAPARQWRRLELSREIDSLERQLLEAIQQENFESAARCRDQLGALRAKLAAPAATP